MRGMRSLMSFAWPVVAGYLQARLVRSQFPPGMRPQTSNADNGALTTMRPAATSAWQAAGSGMLGLLAGALGLLCGGPLLEHQPAFGFDRVGHLARGDEPAAHQADERFAFAEPAGNPAVEAVERVVLAVRLAFQDGVFHS